jgi:predicted RNA-binding protein YlqC (UPF0109 family)
MSNIDQQFIEFVVKSLVGKPEAVKVDRRVDEKGVLLELTVDPEDLGRVIGKRGATAQSLRTLLRALGTKNDARYNLKIIDNGVGHAHADDTAPSNAPVSSDDNDDLPAEPVAAVGTAKTDDAPVLTDVPEDDDVPVQGADEPDEPSDRLAQTRKELADLDDLDV